jgi:hypothetical protein
MLDPAISVSSTICCLSVQLQRRRRSTRYFQNVAMLATAHQGGLTERLRESNYSTIDYIRAILSLGW